MDGFWLAYERRVILVPEYQHKVHKKLSESYYSPFIHFEALFLHTRLKEKVVLKRMYV